MKTKFTKTVLIICAIIVICVTINAWYRIDNYPHKLWLHRCNSLEKWNEKADSYDNIEVDVVWRNDTGFDVTHDIDTSFNQKLPPFLQQLKASGGKMWLDTKNLNTNNIARATDELNQLIAHNQLNKSQLIVESNDTNAINHLDKNGFYTSYYVNFDKPSELNENQIDSCLTMLQTIVDNTDCDAISFPSWWYDEIKEEMGNEDIDLLTWCHRTTQFELFVTPSCYEMLYDPQLKVILVKDKGEHHL